MVKFKKVLCVLMCFVFILSIFIGVNTTGNANSLFDYSQTGSSNLKYQTLSNGNLMITGANSYPAVLVIPSHIDGIPVEKISFNAFYKRYQIREVIISQGVKEIGEYAFAECENLTSVTIPKSVQIIDDSAFWYCDKLGDVEMLGVKHIGMAAFSSCKSMKRIHISNALEEVEFAAFNNSGLTAVDYCGTKSDSYGIEVGTYNDPLINAVWNYCNNKPQTQPPTNPPVGEWVLMGDTDYSGKVNIKDATLVQKYVAKIINFDAKTLFVANVLSADKVNVKAATAIQKYCAYLYVDAEINVEKLYY